MRAQITTNGNSVQPWIQASNANPCRNSVTALIDNDPGSGKVRQRFIKNCDDNGIQVHRLRRYAIENYFTLRALQDVFSTQIPATVTELDSTKRLEDQIGMNVRGANRRIAKVMTIAEIEGTDFFEFLSKVKEQCEAAPKL